MNLALTYVVTLCRGNLKRKEISGYIMISVNWGPQKIPPVANALFSECQSIFPRYVHLIAIHPLNDFPGIGTCVGHLGLEIRGERRCIATVLSQQISEIYDEVEHPEFGRPHFCLAYYHSV